RGPRGELGGTGGPPREPCPPMRSGKNAGTGWRSGSSGRGALGRGARGNRTGATWVDTRSGSPPRARDPSGRDWISVQGGRSPAVHQWSARAAATLEVRPTGGRPLKEIRAWTTE